MKTFAKAFSMRASSFSLIITKIAHMSEKLKKQENAKNQKNTYNVWDLVSCVLSIVECFILKGKSRSESFQKNKSGSRGWTCLVLSKALHLYVFGWHCTSSKIRIFRFAGDPSAGTSGSALAAWLAPQDHKKGRPMGVSIFCRKAPFY